MFVLVFGQRDQVARNYVRGLRYKPRILLSMQTMFSKLAFELLAFSLTFPGQRLPHAVL